MSVSDEQKQQYNEYVKQVTPTHSLPREMFHAFLTGGAICTLGQLITNLLMQAGIEQEAAGTWCSILLILLSVLLTGFNVYPSIAKWGGAGALVPITGFANGVASSAIEYKKRRAGLRHRLQDLHYRRAGDPLRRIHKLGRGAPVLAGQGAGNLKNC